LAIAFCQWLEVIGYTLELLPEDIKLSLEIFGPEGYPGNMQKEQPCCPHTSEENYFKIQYHGRIFREPTICYLYINALPTFLTLAELSHVGHTFKKLAHGRKN
jgi:hypothetical protein